MSFEQLNSGFYARVACKMDTMIVLLSILVCVKYQIDLVFDMESILSDSYRHEKKKNIITKYE